jgi:pilus assembly protein CpaC
VEIMSNQPSSRMVNAGALGLASVFAVVFFFAGIPLRAQEVRSSPAAVSQPQQRETPPPQEAALSERLHLLVGRSLVITTPVRIKRISIADPTIIDAIIIKPTQILLNGKVPGGVSLVLWDEADQSQTFEVFVDLDILGLSQKIREVFPEEPIRVEASKDVVMLSGRASSKAVADKILQIVTAATPKVISLMEAPTAPTSGEILLEVKIAEVNRSAMDQLGINLFSTNPKQIGSISTQQFSPPTLSSVQQTTTTGGSTGTAQTLSANFTLTDLLNVFLFRPDIHVGATLKALQQRNLLQILAEPNLLTETGREANFLAGGEFPFPVVQGGAAGSAPTVSIQFKEFGVRLNFAPKLTENGKIYLKVRPEVSTLDFTNALTVSGFFIPAISTRRVETEMELMDGQSFAIAGLVDDRLTRVADKIPWLGDIPILGYLFRSRTLNKTKTELLVVVTPHIVKPLSADQVPAGPKFPEAFLPLSPAGAPKPPARK